MSDLVHFAPVRAWDRNGLQSPGALARFYEPGTTTPRTVYSDSALSVAHAVPVVADAAGCFPPVYTSGLVKAIITDRDGVALPKGTLDPAYVIPADSSGAGNISFDPTGEIPVSDVQAAIERVQDNAESLVAATGWGITTGTPVLGNLDAANIAAGAYRITSDTIGTRPGAWGGTNNGIAIMVRENATSGYILAARRIDGILWRRTLDVSVWGAWASVEGTGLAQEDWDTATSEVESLINAVKLRAAITAAVSLRVYTSTDQTITSGGLLTLTHGLGAAPSLVQYQLVCVTGEHGYSTGDVVAVGFNAGNTAGNKYNTPTLTATEIQVRFSDAGNCFVLGAKATGAAVVATNANWSLRVKAFA